MSLDKYLEKRSFDQTPEPEGGESHSDKLIFVVQKHAASHLHYDFRLEMKGVLKSWAVPKGPSMKPDEHRLAQEVEDHPYDYKDFEGQIPKGQYGGGTVIIWDEGTYEPVEKIEGGKKEMENWLISHFYKNSLKIRLHGHKLKGDFTLVRMRERGENAWLLSKLNDKYALKTDIVKKDRSVISGLTIEQMAENRDAKIWRSNREEAFEQSAAQRKQAEDTKTEKHNKTPVKDEGNWSRILNKEITSEQTLNFDGQELTFNNIEQELWKGINKAELISYYHTVTPYILPYLEDRPLSLHLTDAGAASPGFYIKDMAGHEPEFAEIFSTERKHKKKGKEDTINYMVCNNEASLLYLINLGCIDLNPWSSRTTSPDEPDFISVDLDPSDNDFNKVIQTTLAAKEVFDKYKLKAALKTSGKTGMHLFVPCNGFDFAEARKLAELLCSEVQKLVPEISTTEVTIAHRGDKLFVDASQNDFGDTLASAYSARPYYQPTVSTPLTWDEVNENLHPGNFTIQTVPDRIKQKGDLFKELFDEKIKASNSKILKKLL